MTPRTAAIWAALRRALDARPARLDVVDVGGGTGGFAVPLAEAGHTVTVIDASPDALASLGRRAAEAGVGDRVHAVQGDGDQLAALVPPGSADLVLCHSVLEVVDDPAAVVAAIAAALRPGGLASVVVANRTGAVLSRALAGQLSAAAALLPEASPEGVAPETAPRGSFVTNAARRDLYGDTFNESVLMRPGQWLTRLSVFFDGRGVDGLVNGLAAAIGGTSGRLRKVQTGFVRSYALSMLIGAVLLVAGLLVVRL